MPSESAEAEPQAGRQALRSFLFAATALLLLLFLTAGSQLLRTQAGTRHAAGGLFPSIWPQRWGFFANYADTDLAVAYRFSADGGPRAVLDARQASLAEDWGLSREDMAESTEAAHLAAEVPASSRRHCGVLDSAACVRLAAAHVPIALTDRYPASRLCGNLVLVLEGPEVPTGRVGQDTDGRTPLEAMVRAGHRAW